MRNYYLACIFLFLLFSTFPFQTVLASEIGQDSKTATNTVSASFPQTVYCSSSEKFLFTWTGNNDGTDRIYYSFHTNGDLDGTPGTTGTLLSTATAIRYAERPKVAYDLQSQTAAVVWLESRTEAKDSVMLALINTDTETKITELVVASNNVWNMAANVASDGQGTYLVVYFESSSQTIFGQLVDASGTLQGTTITLGQATTNYLLPYAIDLAYNTQDDAFLVTWADHNSNLFSKTVKIDATTGTLNNYTTISNVATPAIVYNSSVNQFLIAYDDLQGQIHAILTDNTGIEQPGIIEFGDASSTEGQPAVATHPTNNSFVVSWNNQTEDEVWAQEFSTTPCSNFGTPFKLSDLSSISHAPQISYDPLNGYFWVSWFGRSSEAKDEVFTQRITTEINTIHAVCKDISVTLDGDGTYTLSPSEIDNGSSVPCETPKLSLSKTDLSCTDGPEVTITLYVSNAAGETESCQAKVTIIDNLAPTALCKDTTIYLDENGAASITAEELGKESTDNCEVTTFDTGTTPLSFDCSQLGNHTIPLTVSDAAGNTTSCTATVTVLDTISPTVACKDTTLYLDAIGEASIINSELLSNLDDNCSGSELLSPDLIHDFNCNSIGEQTIKLTVSDGSGNSRTCNALISIKDTIAPVIVGKTITLPLDENGAANILNADLVENMTDNCSAPSLKLADQINRFSCSDIGQHEIILTAIDLYGNEASSKASITIVDNTSPTAICKDTTIYMDENGVASITAKELGEESTDNCEVTVFDTGTSPLSFDCSQLGNHSIPLTVSDAAGNTAFCTATVTVLDTISPTVTCDDITIYLDENSKATLALSDLTYTAIDNCAIQSIELTPTAFTCADIGEQAVLLKVTDQSGNFSTYSLTVTIAENNPPVALCKDITISLTSDEARQINPSEIDDGSYDDCSAVTLQFKDGPIAFGVSNIGANNVTLLVQDESGNTSSCDATITVVDEVPPVALCQDITVYLDDDGKVNITSSFIDAGSYDNVGIQQTHIDRTQFTCTDIGNNKVTLTLTDFDGNSSFCTSTVTVVENISPQLEQLPDIILDANANCTAQASFGLPTATDNCDVHLTQTEGLPSGSEFPAGATTVTFKATDPSGNNTTMSFQVIVNSSIMPPQLAELSDLTIPAHQKQLTIALNEISSGATCQQQLPVQFSVTSSNHEIVQNTSVYYEAGANTGTLFLNRQAGTFGDATIAVTISNEQASITKEFLLTVLENRPPEISQEIVEELEIEKGQTKELVLSADLFSDPDEGDQISIELKGTDGQPLPDWVHFDPETRTIQFSPTNSDHVRAHSFNLVGTDLLGAQALGKIIVTVNFPTNVDLDQDQQTIKVYPNPTSGKLTVFIADRRERCTIQLLNLTGKLIKQQTVAPSESIQFDLSDQPDGIYLLQLDEQYNFRSYKVILQK
ncbi:HYR domain-containing protein [Sunxiuqinia elliptica]|uniref:Por secretion system C-terminal sorting domain-containing protein n=1 Tax=Sunxiuqinia elliptica TaxID=655355 RepID=A0A1I2FEX9_9BACT|nr:HYR domain-containing protein [Sunxiuqinia elliptica]SFF03130.1 Por secretion system C-terminal sorting domain-containing protein [Sunxiuqinia elliptica]